MVLIVCNFLVISCVNPVWHIIGGEKSKTLGLIRVTISGHLEYLRPNSDLDFLKHGKLLYVSIIWISGSTQDKIVHLFPAVSSSLTMAAKAIQRFAISSSSLCSPVCRMFRITFGLGIAMHSLTTWFTFSSSCWHSRQTLSLYQYFLRAFTSSTPALIWK